MKNKIKLANIYGISFSLLTHKRPASEPNLLKIRLKQSVIERNKARVGPAARRQERLLSAHQRRLQKIALAQASSM